MPRLERTLLEHMSTAVLVLDPDLRLTHLNQAAESLLKLSRARHLGRYVDELLLETPGFAASLLTAQDTGQSFTKREAHLRLPQDEGIEVLADITVTPLLQDADGLLLEIQALDRLKRISREAALLSVHATTRELVRALAHEIKNPLGGIRGAAQLLERERPTPDVKDYTGVIISETDRLRTLVDRMLGAGHKLHKGPVNIHEVIEHVVVLVTAESPGRLSIVRHYDPSLPEICADRDRLVQALLNIARNAVEAMADQDDPELRLNTRCVRQHTIGDTLHRIVLAVDVIDNGPGIDEAIRERLFYPMISGRANGTGLGLSIAQTIINQHGGLIECASRPGETRFTLIIPPGDPL